MYEIAEISLNGSSLIRLWYSKAWRTTEEVMWDVVLSMAPSLI